MKAEKRFLIIEFDILQNDRLALSEKLILAYILSYYRMDPKGAFIRSNSFIAQELGLTVRTVNRAIKSLEAHSIIRCKYARSQGVHSNRIIEILALIDKNKPDFDLLELFNSVYSSIKN